VQGVVPSELTAQFVLHSWSLPVLFLGGAEEHFGRDCMFPLFGAKALLCCHRNPENQAGWESW